MEVYRSGHNEAVLKTVWVKAPGGSNPSTSASVGRILKCGRHIFVLGVLQGLYSPLKSLKRQHPLSG